MRWAVIVALLVGCVQITRANTVNANTCAFADVNACFTGTGGTCSGTVTAGGTVNVPPGTCTWTSGVSWSNGASVVGAGAGRVIAYDQETTALTLATGSKSFTNLTGDTACAKAGCTAPSFTNGESLRIFEDGWFGNYFTGTVTSWNGTTLVFNATTAAGTCGQTDPNGMNSNCKRWLISTLPSTIICNNLASGSLFDITENTTFDASVSGIFVGEQSDPRCSAVTASGTVVSIGWVTGGLPVLIHDMFFEHPSAGGTGEVVDSNTNRGVIWNSSFAESPFSMSQGAAIRIKDDNNVSIAGYAWSHVVPWGAQDTNENLQLYFETNDLHAMNVEATDCDSGCELVFRYNFIDNSGIGSHGADTSTWGMRSMDIYQNVFAYDSDTSFTANLSHGWMYMRGGTFLWHDNINPTIDGGGGYWSAESTTSVILQNLERNAGNDPCWGLAHTSAGQFYHAPRQSGMGYRTGTGTAAYTGVSPNPVYTVNGSTDSVGYVGDSEPLYFWNNSPAATVGTSDYTGTGACNNTNNAADLTANYFAQNRDYFLATAPPTGSVWGPSGYVAATYPNPYTGGQPAATPTAPTPMIMTADNVAQYLFGAPLPRGR